MKKDYLVAIQTIRAKTPRIFVFDTKKNAMSFMREAKKGGCKIAFTTRPSERTPKRNFTFRLNDSLLEDFAKYCRKKGISQTAQLEQLIEALVN